MAMSPSVQISLLFSVQLLYINLLTIWIYNTTEHSYLEKAKNNWRLWWLKMAESKWLKACSKENEKMIWSWYNCDCNKWTKWHIFSLSDIQATL